ncbi:transglutaminaseTgpA domain-containing protein [Bifidobacterium avesanii]|uniref:transglutaminaseTgpA domain-containing protein n=1 Tax=Bifidobacterium avesanii TaxID=1798157 RepID=UPI0013D5EFD0|nr:transglutaminaseTgpA domain-containing protein [Bifidobacterium avesanii]
MRPTAAGVVALLLGGLCCFLALLLDDRAIAAATLALWIAPLTSLTIALIQRRLAPGVVGPAAANMPVTGVAGTAEPGVVGAGEAADRDGIRVAVPARGWRRFVLPRVWSVAPQWERLDQYGAVVRRGAGAIPPERGLYRRLALAVTWSDPFGLIRQRLMLHDGGETLMLPAESDPSADASLAADARMQDQSSGETASSVRQYAPGDSPRLISWRHTAHRGELMTRESDRDVRVMTLIVVDTTVEEGLAADLDAAAAYALGRLVTMRADAESVAVSDGETVLTGRGGATRFLAAMRPVVKAGPGDGPGGGSAAKESKEPKQAVTPEQRVAIVAAFVAAQRRPLRIVLVTAGKRTPLAAAFAASAIGDRVGVHPVGSVAVTEGEPAAKRPCVAIGGGAAAGTGGPGSPEDARSWGRLSVTGRVAATAALVALHVVALVALNGLVELKGMWAPFAVFGLIAVTCEAMLFPPRTAWRSARRVVVAALLVALAALLAMAVRIHGITGEWVFARSSEPVGGGTDRIFHWNFGLLPETLSDGAWDMYVQLPPLTVSPHSDVFLIAMAAVAVVLLRCLLSQPTAAVAVPVVPASVMAVGFAFVGQTPSYAMIGATVFASLVLLWAVKPVRALAPMPVVASALVTALTLSLTPSATSFAVGVPLAVGTPGGLFSTSTVNPLVDLKRGLAQGSNNVVFEYRTYDGNPYYFRLATLDDFNGDTWRYDPQLASDGGLYGGRPNFGASPQSDQLSRRTGGQSQEQYVESLTPLRRTIVAVNDSGGRYSGGLSAADGAIAESMVGQAQVDITTLASRFLPVLGDAQVISGLSADEQREWYQADDGTVFSPSALTGEGLSYAVSGASLTPIGSAAQFRQIETLDRLRASYLDYVGGGSSASSASGMSTSERESLRRSLARNGYATVSGDYLVVNLRVNMSDDAVAGTITDADGMQVDDDAHSLPALRNGGVSLEFARRFRDKLGIQVGEGFGVLAMDSSGTMALVLRLDGRTMGQSNEGFRLAMSRLAGERNSASYTLATVTARQTQRRTIGITAEQLNDDGTGLRLRPRYGTLPAELPEHVQAVVDEAKADGVPTDGANEANQVATMRWLVNYLTQPDFVYSLNQPDGNGRGNLDVVDDFLVSRSGYCTHYASALAVLGRAMGLSTRIVLGYNANATVVDPSDGSSGRTSRFSTHYEVQAKQLHSWTEVYIDNIGWTPFDVTPASGGGNGVTSGGEEEPAQTAPSASASSSSSSASASASASESTSSASDDPSASDSASSGEAAGDRTDAVKPARLPGWAATALWTVLGLALAVGLALAPAGLRERRRRSRLHVIDQAAAVGDDDALNRRAWKAAWAEALDCARDVGAGWPATATDGEVASELCERFGAMGLAGDGVEAIRTLADRAITAAYGSPRTPVAPPDATVPRLLAALRARASTVQRLLPRSLFARR